MLEWGLCIGLFVHKFTCARIQCRVSRKALSHQAQRAFHTVWLTETYSYLTEKISLFLAPSISQRAACIIPSNIYLVIGQRNTKKNTCWMILVLRNQKNPFFSEKSSILAFKLWAFGSVLPNLSMMSKTPIRSEKKTYGRQTTASSPRQLWLNHQKPRVPENRPVGETIVGLNR